MSTKRTIIYIALTIGLLLTSAFAEDPIRDQNQPLAPMWQLQSPTVAWWTPEIYSWAKKYDLNPNIVATLMQIESCGNPESISTSSAQGLFQVMPFNFPKEYLGKMKEPDINAQVGLEYYNYVLGKAKGDWKQAFAAYNGGPSQLNKPFVLWPDETQRYFRWAQMAADGMAGAKNSDVLGEWMRVSGGGMCKKAEIWQNAHPRDSSIKIATQPGAIVIDLPPSILMLLLVLIAWLISKQYVNVGNGLLWLLTILTIAIWFPLNLTSEKEKTYTNIVFETRRWYDQNKGIADVMEYVRKGEKNGIPIPSYIGWVMSAYEKSNRFSLDVSLWVSNDPIFTPLSRLANDFVWPSLYGQNQTNQGEYTLPFREPVKLRVVQDARGAKNPYGIHGNFCFRCIGIRSWLGTDIVLAPEQKMYAPVGGIVERVIVDGGDAVGGSSVWITSKTVRFAIVHIHPDDANKFNVGDIVFAGQALGRQDPGQGHVHVVFELQSPDGSWGDYPFVFVLVKTGVRYEWYDRKYTYTDLYVPTTSEMLRVSEFLKEAVPK